MQQCLHEEHGFFMPLYKPGQYQTDICFQHVFYHNLHDFKDNEISFIKAQSKSSGGKSQPRVQETLLVLSSEISFVLLQRSGEMGWRFAFLNGMG